MSWDWVGDYPVFIYTTWRDNGIFDVDIIIGTKNDQNAGNTGPHVKPDFSYTEKDFLSKNDVVKRALRLTKTQFLPQKIRGIDSHTEIPK